jgi:sucrose-6-phosphatase
MQDRSRDAMGVHTQTKCYIVTDLDNTLVGNSAATQEFNQKILKWESRVGLIYATGRSYESAKQLQKSENLLEPHYWITGVGSEIYHQGELDQSWSEHLTHQWHRSKILDLAADFPELTSQPNESQNDFKISFYLYENADEILNQLRDRIDKAGFAAQVVYSSREDLDILPVRCDKGLAMRHLMVALGLTNGNTIVCGDSGNDIGLFKQNTLGVIVNNAQGELLDWYREYGGDSHERLRQRIYYAKTDCAAGMLEGILQLRSDLV